MTVALTRIRRGLVLAVVVLLALVTQEFRSSIRAAADPDAGISVSGNLLLRDGTPFLPRGFNLIGLLTPDWCKRSTGIAARDHLGDAEFAAAHAWGADTLRFQVSQRGLADPTVLPADRSAYLQHVVDGVTAARDAGFVVIVSMQDQTYGCGDIHPLPSAETVDAWTALAPALMADPYVMFELFNEPQNDPNAAGWRQWLEGGPTPDANLGDVAVGHQALVDHVRSLGATNVLIADGASFAKQTIGMPQLAGDDVAYAIHPYNFTRGEVRWDLQYGDAAAEVPLLATEWNYLSDACGLEKERLAPDLLDYLRRHHIGVLGHAFDALRTTVADWNWTPTSCGSAVGGSGAVLQSFFASLEGLDTVPPAVPANLRAADLTTEHVELAWDADADAVSYVVIRDGDQVAEPTGPAWTDTAVQPEETHTYAVRAVDAAGNVSGNAVVAVTTPPPPPPPPDTTPPTAPGSLTARVVSPTQVSLRWPAATDDVGVESYQVLRDGVVLATTTGRTATDSSVTAGPHEYGVVALDAAGNPSPAATDSVEVPPPAPRGLTGTYFDTATFTAQKVVRIDATVNFGWGTGRPATGVGADTFSVRWTGRVLLPADGTWTFYASSDDAIRVWIDGRLVVDDGTAHALRESRGSVALTADRSYVVQIEYVERTRSATARLSWSGPGTAKQIVPSAQLLAR